MLEILLRVVFTLVSNLMQIILAPFINLILGMFPDSQIYFNYVVQFLGYGFTYVGTILRWFLITAPMMMLLFDYYAVKFSIWVVSSGIRFGLKLYNVLKP